MTVTDVCEYCGRAGRDGHTPDCSYYKAKRKLAFLDEDKLEVGSKVKVRLPPENTTRLPTDSGERKRYPVFSGFMQYFPDAVAYVANISWAGNEKHNPGQPLHWSRNKSSDHLDCIGRHLVEAGTVDPGSGFLHDGMLAWRALANLQIVLEKLKGVPISPGSKET